MQCEKIYAKLVCYSIFLYTLSFFLPVYFFPANVSRSPLCFRSSPRTPMMGPTGEAEEEELEMEERSSSEDIHEVANDTHITKEPCLTSFSEDELSNTMPRKPRNSSVSGSILSVETVRQIMISERLLSRVLFTDLLYILWNCINSVQFSSRTFLFAN